MIPRQGLRAVQQRPTSSAARHCRVTTRHRLHSQAAACLQRACQHRSALFPASVCPSIGKSHLHRPVSGHAPAAEKSPFQANDECSFRPDSDERTVFPVRSAFRVSHARLRDATRQDTHPVRRSDAWWSGASLPGRDIAQQAARQQARRRTPPSATPSPILADDISAIPPCFAHSPDDKTPGPAVDSCLGQSIRVRLSERGRRRRSGADAQRFAHAERCERAMSGRQLQFQPPPPRHLLPAWGRRTSDRYGRRSGACTSERVATRDASFPNQSIVVNRTNFSPPLVRLCRHGRLPCRPG